MTRSASMMRSVATTAGQPSGLRSGVGADPASAADSRLKRLTDIEARLDPDAARAAVPQDIGERLVVALHWHDDGHVGREVGRRLHEAPGDGLIAEVDHEHATGGREDDEAGGPHKSRQVADIRQVRHDERIDGGGAHALPGAIKTGENRKDATVHLVVPGARAAAGQRPRQRAAWTGASRLARTIAARNASSSTSAGGSGATATSADFTAMRTGAETGGGATGDGAARVAGS